MLMVTSLTIFAQSTPRDLQTELQKFWPNKAEFNKNVWQLYPVDMSEMNVYDNGVPVIKAPIASRVEEFSLSSQSNGMVEFDSDFYKLNFDKSAPTVKGVIFSLDAKYDTKGTYIGIIYDNRILENNKGRPDSKDEFDQPFRKVSQADFEVANNQDPGSYDTGIPIIRYGQNNQNNLVATPKMIVKIFKIGHPVGDFMESHSGQKLEKVLLATLDKTMDITVKITKAFKNDYLYPLGIAFVFGDKKKELYSLYRTSSDFLILVSEDFLWDWQP